jgi:two-component system sensor histidine kinase PhoQ
MSPAPGADEAGTDAAGRGRRTPLSLRARLAVAATLVLVAFLSGTGVVLDRAFASAIEDSAREQLRLHVLALLGTAELDDGVLSLPPALPEPRFNQPGSGLYARLLDADGAPVWTSRSVATLSAPDARGPTLAPGRARFDTDATVAGEPAYRYGFGVLWEGPAGDASYTLHVTAAQAPFLAETRAFRRTLYTLLGGAAAGLLLAQFGILALALVPLGRVETQVQRVERGDAERLEGAWPAELAGLARNLNLLIDHERARQQRYRTTLDDLAHSLKTPLAILRNALTDGDARALADAQGQIDRMDAIVGHHLQRASVGPDPLRRGRTALAPPLRRIADGLRRLHADRDLDVAIDVPDGLAVAVDERDLYELLGNLVENACKYGESRVRVAAARRGARVHVTVADDGPGVPEALRRSVLDRGARADTATSGQGIGLAVVAELVAAYGGGLAIDAADLGGAAVHVDLPAADAGEARPLDERGISRRP